VRMVMGRSFKKGPRNPEDFTSLGGRRRKSLAVSSQTLCAWTPCCFPPEKSFPPPLGEVLNVRQSLCQLILSSRSAIAFVTPRLEMEARMSATEYMVRSTAKPWRTSTASKVRRCVSSTWKQRTSPPKNQHIKIHFSSLP
jgi:hypothetical protein